MTVFAVNDALARVLDGGAYALLGLLVVMLVLALIWGILAIFGAVLAPKSKKSNVEALESRNERDDAVVTAHSDDGETVAAISAAISVLLAEEAEREERPAVGFRVVSFKKTNGRPWNE